MTTSSVDERISGSRPPTGHVLHGRSISAALRGERPHRFTRVNSLERGRRERRTAIESRCEVHSPSRGRDDPETEHGGRHDARQQLGKSASKSGFVANVSHHRRTHRPRRLPAGSAIYRLGKTNILELPKVNFSSFLIGQRRKRPMKSDCKIRAVVFGCCFGGIKAAAGGPWTPFPHT